MKGLSFKRVIAILLAMTILVLTGCGNGGSDTKSGTDSDGQIKSSKDTLIVALPSDPANFDPNSDSIQMVHAMKRQIYEPLIMRDNEGNLQPQLAESWEYEDDKTIIFHLRKGVKFHNGDELKASDVIFTYKRIADEVPAAQVAVNMIDFDKSMAIDDYTVKIATKDVYVPQLAYLEWPLTSIFSEKAYKESNGDFTKAPIGTGPYRLVDYISGDSYVFEAYEDYWDEGKPYMKNLIIRVISEAANRTIELETGGVDIIYEAPSTDIPRLSENDDITVYRDLSMNTNYLLIRTDHPPFDDVRVRQAVAYALDTDTAVKTAYKGTGVTAYGFISPNIEGFAEDVMPYEYNIEKAKQLLAEAGYPNGFETTFHTDTTRERIDISEIFQNQLAKVGIKCKVISMEPVAYQAMFAQGEHNIMVYGLTTTTGEGDKALRWFHSEHTTGQSFVNWKVPEYDKLIDDAAKETDMEKRLELYRQAQQMLKDECVIIPTLHREILTAARNNVKGFENNFTFEAPSLKGVYIE
jgi:peptide/nickel transport system substrate-binding protein